MFIPTNITIGKKTNQHGWLKFFTIRQDYVLIIVLNEEVIWVLCTGVRCA